MSEHLDHLLELRAARALSSAEEEKVAAHLLECEECQVEEREWGRMAEAFRRLPDAAPSSALLARTRAAVERWQAEREERVWNRVALGFLIVFGWTLTGVAWLLLEIFVGALAARLDQPVGSTEMWFVVYLVAGWVMAGAAAVMLGRRAPAEGRIA